jgi:hypothetical protein
MRTSLIAVGVFGLYVLHQDFWFWDRARPLVFGFLPVGLFYHAVYSLAVVLLMIVLVRYAWPSSLEQQAEDDGSDPSGSGA